MQLIYEMFGYPLGFIMWGIYYLVKNYGIAILLFTLVTKILLFPLSVKQQKNTAMMSAFQPKLQALQKKYANNQQKLQEEQMKLYAEEGINPMSSCLPMLIQFPVLFGIIDVVYRPLTHIMHFSKDMIAEATLIAQNVILEAQANGEAWAMVVKNVENLSKNYQSQLIIMQAYNDNPAAFASMPELCKAVSNFEEYGGAPLLGLNGICIIGHGSSTPKAIRNAIRVANEFAIAKVPEQISNRIYECGVEKEVYAEKWAPMLEKTGGL